MVDLSHHPKLDYFGRPIEEDDIYTAEFSLTQPLYTGGKLTNQRAQAKEGLRKVPLEKAKIELEVALEVIPSYYQAISYQEQAQQRIKLLGTARQQVKEAQEGVKRGVLLREDYLDAKARLAELGVRGDPGPKQGPGGSLPAQGAHGHRAGHGPWN